MSDYACMNWFWEEEVTHRLMFLLADNDQDEKQKVRNLNDKLEELLNGLEIIDPKRTYDNHPIYAFKHFLQIYCLKVDHEATMRILTWLEDEALGKIKLLDEKYRTPLFKKFERMGFVHDVVDERFLDDDLFMCDDMFLDDDLFICNDLIGSV